MEQTVPTSVLAVCVVFTALITSLVFMVITCITIRTKRFDILYQIEQDHTAAKIRELDLQETEVKGAERRAREAGYGKDDIEGLAPYFQIDLRGNLEKKVLADQVEAERKAGNRRSGWFKKTIAEVSAPAAPRVNEEERIRQQLEAHRQLQDEQLMASYARLNTTVASGNRLPVDTKQFDFGTGEIRNQATELEFLSSRRNEDDILPIPQRSPKMSPVPSAMGSPTSVRSMTLNKVPSGTMRKIEEPAPFASLELRQAQSDGRLRGSRSRPSTPGSMLSYREERGQGHAYGYGHGFRRIDGDYNPNNVL